MREPFQHSSSATFASAINRLHRLSGDRRGRAAGLDDRQSADRHRAGHRRLCARLLPDRRAILIAFTTGYAFIGRRIVSTGAFYIYVAAQLALVEHRAAA